jgi:stage IV sporulation protein FB
VRAVRGAPRLRVHPLFLALLAVAVAGGFIREAALLVASLLAHEAAHLAAAAALELEVEELELLPFGGVAHIPQLGAAEPAVEATVALAGPLGSLLLCVAAVWLRERGWLEPGLGGFYLGINLTLGAVNLLPALPLDGGRVARALLAGRLGYGRATLAVVRSGRLCALALCALALLAWRLGTFSPGAFVFAYFTFAAARRERWLGELRTWRELLGRGRQLAERGAVAVRPLAVSAAAPLQSLLPELAPGRYHVVWVLAADGTALGVADEARLLEAMQRFGPLAPARRLLEAGSGRPPQGNT